MKPTKAHVVVSEEQANANLVIGIMSGQLPGWDVNLKLKSVKPGDDAFARIWLGVLPDMTLSEATAAAKERWPSQFKTGLLLRHLPGRFKGQTRSRANDCKTIGRKNG